MTPKPPTPKQLAYLKTLAARTGQTFTWPASSAAASREIQRLKNTPPSTRSERAVERYDDRPVIEAAQDAAAIQGFELVGFGSTASWSQRS